MAKQVKIKDIAQMAGVSAGTVDRILHNRGNVSEASRKAVERVIAETGYKYNIHTSAVSLKKEYTIVISIPTAVEGEYWGTVENGIRLALEEYSDIKIKCEFSYYNQFDIYSCRSAFDSIAGKKPSAVIIGPTFISETARLCEKLDKENIPYAFVDSVIENTHPSVSYSSDQKVCGHIVGRLLDSFTPDSGEFAIFGSSRIGNERSNNSLARVSGLYEYFRENGLSRTIRESKFSVLDPEESENDIVRFIETYPGTKGIAVLNSRGYIVADILSRHKIEGMTVVSFDLTANNIRCINENSISAVICQRPGLQGFHAIKSLIHTLLYNFTEKNVHHFMPTDIIIKENLPFYKEIYE